MSFTKGLKKRPPAATKDKSKDEEYKGNSQLDANAYTETNPFVSFEKMAVKKKSGSPFVGGFQKTVKDVAPDTNPMRLYPGPEQPWNISGSDKVANALMTPPKPPGRMMTAAPKTMSTAKRVTPDIGAYGAPKGASGVAGRSITQPFKQSFGNFGHKTRYGLKSISRLKRGM